MPPAGFEPTIPVSERPLTHALDRAATAIDCMYIVQTFVIVLAVIINFKVTISMEQNPV
jgi:hypothetical protein